MTLFVNPDVFFSILEFRTDYVEVEFTIFYFIFGQLHLIIQVLYFWITYGSIQYPTESLKCLVAKLIESLNTILVSDAQRGSYQQLDIRRNPAAGDGIPVLQWGHGLFKKKYYQSSQMFCYRNTQLNVCLTFLVQVQLNCFCLRYVWWAGLQGYGKGRAGPMCQPQSASHQTWWLQGLGRPE